ncbi:MAG: Fe-S cluster assembly scaffold IscU [Proteobacteria bacterium]|nr:Fe-S cluster assembly scaffold IscU [Pseudomonadota bacterium]
MAYNQKIIDHYENPRNIGSFSKDEANVGTGLVGAPSCGDVMKLQIKVNPETQVIEDVKCKTFGCMSAIAASSYASEQMIGKTIEEVMQMRNSDIVEALSLPPAKIHCSVLAEDAFKSAVRDYQQKAQTTTDEAESAA